MTFRKTSCTALLCLALAHASAAQTVRGPGDEVRAVRLDAPLRIVRSGSTGRVIRVPDDVVFDAMLAARCNQRPAGPTISFFASGMSCGGAIALTRLGVGYEIRVNWLTGGVEVVPSERL